jgi:hypothetical protein
MKKHILTRASLLVRLSAITCIFVFATAATSNKPTNDETMKAAAFRTYTGMKTFFSQDFDFDYKCSIQSFELMYQRRQDDPMIIPNKGWAFTKPVRTAVKNAKPGDIYVFSDIRARCPGDYAARKLPSIIVTVR